MCFILGPTEVQWHAKARLVAGCEYYIVGRGTFLIFKNDFLTEVMKKLESFLQILLELNILMEVEIYMM